MSDDDRAEQVHRLLRSRGHTLATAESLTGGRLGVFLTDVPGASQTYLGGVITYATELKQSLLGVSDDIVSGPGVVSAECAAAMADGVRKLTGATYGVATTGVAGPDEQEGKPPGRVYIGIAGPDHVWTNRLDSCGTRNDIQMATCHTALGDLVLVLEQEHSDVR